jgi:uncharacterized protein YjbI with pentapeptide repeats
MFAINDAEFRYGTIAGNVPPHPLSATFVVKATLAMKPGDVAEFLPEDDHAHLNGEESFGDDPAKGVRVPSDFAPWKPNAEAFLAGSCHIPEGRKVDTCLVTFAIGSWSKPLAVLGSRTRKRGLLGYSQPKLSPFSRRELSWENTYGGTGYAPNPAGMGRDKIILPDGTKTIEMPTVEYPGQIVKSSTGGGTPASYSPLGESWTERMAKAKKASWNKEWLEKQWPWFPKNFDWSYFNAAPSDQQFKDWFRGDERFLIEFMHPDHPKYECRLPGIRPRLFVQVRHEDNRLEFREVPVVLDTIFVDMDKEQVLLTWRGHTPALTPKMKEFEDIYLLREPLGKPLFQTVGEYGEQYRKRKEEMILEGDFKPTLIEPLVITPPALPDTSWVGPMEKEMEELRKEGEKRFSPETIPGFKESGAAAIPKAPPPPPSAPVVKPDAVIAQVAKDWKVMAASDAFFAKNYLPPQPDLAFLKETEKEFAEEFPEKPDKEEEEEVDTEWTRERVIDHLAKDGHFEEEDLSELDLSGLDFSGRRFREAELDKANLAGSRFDNADLTEASFTGADITEASFQQANLTETDMSEAKGPRTDFSGATIELTDFTGADLSGAQFPGVTGEYPDFSECTLPNSVFEKANLVQPDFTGANLFQASFREAILPDAGFYEIDAEETDFSGCSMKNARFSEGRAVRSSFLRVHAPEAAWDDAILEGSDFSKADLSSGVFTGAVITRAKFDLADLAESNIDDVTAHETSFVGTNLFQCTLDGSDFSEAIFLGANLFWVETFRTTFHKADFREANVGRTSIEQ